ncbi:hypothetical protein [Sphingopyxis fribergensis]
MNDLTANMRRLIEALYIKSINQEISWSFFHGADLCEAEFGEGFVQTIEEANEDGDYYCYARILNSDKEVIDNIYGGTLGNKNKPYNTDHKSYFELLRDLHTVAKRNALGADRLISSLLSALGAENLPVSDDDVPF